MLSTHRIGILTGSGPEAGLDLWSKVLEENRLRVGETFRGDIDAPNVTVLSVPELGHSMNLPETSDVVWRHLRSACEQIAPQVDAYAIACNTLYYFDADIRALALPAELISPVDCVRVDAVERSPATVALLGSAPVTTLDGTSSPYRHLRNDLALEVHPDRSRLHELIEQIKLAGGSTTSLEAEFAAIVGGLESTVAYLACTELPLLLADDITIELVDVTRLLARALVDYRI